MGLKLNHVSKRGSSLYLIWSYQSIHRHLHLQVRRGFLQGRGNGYRTRVFHYKILHIKCCFVPTGNTLIHRRPIDIDYQRCYKSNTHKLPSWKPHMMVVGVTCLFTSPHLFVFKCNMPRCRRMYAPGVTRSNLHLTPLASSRWRPDSRL